MKILVINVKTIKIGHPRVVICLILLEKIVAYQLAHNVFSIHYHHGLIVTESHPNDIQKES